MLEIVYVHEEERRLAGRLTKAQTLAGNIAVVHDALEDGDMKAAYTDVLQRSATELESGPQVEDVLARLELHVDMESSALTSLARTSLVTDADVDAAIREAQAAPRVTRPFPLRVTPPVGSGPLGSSSSSNGGH